ncbi:hypothetical protein CUMW_009010 [Citrus unshiu]|nr:hypothetical protein CUMW_009010 [Citrus unshiu]
MYDKYPAKMSNVVNTTHVDLRPLKIVGLDYYRNVMKQKGTAFDDLSFMVKESYGWKARLLKLLDECYHLWLKCFLSSPQDFFLAPMKCNDSIVEIRNTSFFSLFGVVLSCWDFKATAVVKRKL